MIFMKPGRSYPGRCLIRRLQFFQAFREAKCNYLKFGIFSETSHRPQLVLMSRQTFHSEFKRESFWQDSRSFTAI